MLAHYKQGSILTMLVSLPNRSVEKLPKGYLNVISKLHLKQTHCKDALTDMFSSKNEDVYLQSLT